MWLHVAGEAHYEHRVPRASPGVHVVCPMGVEMV